MALYLGAKKMVPRNTSKMYSERSKCPFRAAVAEQGPKRNLPKIERGADDARN